MMVRLEMNEFYNKENRIGFEMRENKLELILPSFIKDRDLDKEEISKEKIKYFRLFRKYNQSSKELRGESLYNTGSSQKEEYMYSIFEAYYLLLMDYMDLGPFIFTETRTNKHKKGRINWSRTINKSNLLMSDDNLIYKDPYYTNKKIQYNHPLTIIYGMYLLKIERVTGLKINIHSQYRKSIENNKGAINISRVLDNFRTSIYSDRERKVINLFYIINDNNRKLDRVYTSTNLYYLENLNNIWESMLKDILDDEYYSFKNTFPRGQYNLNIEGEDIRKAGLRIIPDIIKEHDDQLYIIDAKNYLPHISKNIPGSSDINKQILYRYFLSKEFNSENKFRLDDIKNIFLLPNDLEGEVIRKVGGHKIIDTDNTIGDISLYQVDFNSIVDAYINNDKIAKDKILKVMSEAIY